MDIIHTNGAMKPCAPEVIYGLQTPLGHYDFYPSATEEVQRQLGCRDWDLDWAKEFGHCRLEMSTNIRAFYLLSVSNRAL